MEAYSYLDHDKLIETDINKPTNFFPNFNFGTPALISQSNTYSNRNRTRKAKYHDPLFQLGTRFDHRVIPYDQRKTPDQIDSNTAFLSLLFEEGERGFDSNI